MVRAEISRVDEAEDHEQSREDASQKPYSPSPGAGSRRRRVRRNQQGRRCRSSEISRVDEAEDHEQSREDASQKPYLPSPGAGSRRRRVPETCSPDRRCTSAVGTKGTKRRLSYEERRKRNWDDLEAGCRAPFIGPSPRPLILSAHENLAFS
jgi:hypothetical protein